MAVCSASDTSDNQEVLMAGRNYHSIHDFASAIPNHLLLGSLLEHLCFVYESNPARSRMLFKGKLGTCYSSQWMTIILRLIVIVCDIFCLRQDH